MSWGTKELNKKFIKEIEKYFSDDANFIEIIKQENFGYRDYIEIAQAYITYKKQ